MRRPLLSYGRPKLIRLGNATVMTQSMNVGETFDSGSSLLRKGETNAARVHSQQDTDAGSTTEV